MKKLMSYFFCIFMLISVSEAFAADTKADFSKGQALYVPAYSHIYIGNNERKYLLAVTLSIRNIDPSNSIVVDQVDYYETDGMLLKKFLSKPLVVQPLGSIRYVVPEHDKSGGSGANFIVKWSANKNVNPPIVESIMIGTTGGQGISFTSRGREIIKSD